MPDVEFSEEKEYARELSRPEKKRGGLARLIKRLGLAKDETGANIVLAGIALLVIILTVVLFFAAS